MSDGLPDSEQRARRLRIQIEYGLIAEESLAGNYGRERAAMRS
jgi:hypothetical protein